MRSHHVHEGRREAEGKALSLFVFICRVLRTGNCILSSMETFDCSLSEADRMAQGACDGSGATRPDYVFSEGINGMGPDGAQHTAVDPNIHASTS